MNPRSAEPAAPARPHAGDPTASEPRGGDASGAVDAAPLEARPREWIGRTVAGAYEIREELGRGGMGIVFKARHLPTGEDRALKFLLAGSHATERELARFLAEARALARLCHENLVPIRDVGQDDDGSPFYAMKLVLGDSLESLGPATGFPTRRSVEVLARVARGVHHAHEHGIVHRDLKPANVLVERATGRPYVVDFGLAKDLGDGRHLTSTGVTVGTPHYMAPEQARGKHDEVDARTDIYSLGSILYEILAGRPPFQADCAPDLLHQIVYEEPPPPSRFGRVPESLERIALRTLAKKREERFQTALELASALEEALAREDDWAPDGSPVVRTSVPSVPGFAVGEVLGRGGTTVVYRARELSSGEDVALRWIPERGASSSHRVAREKALSRLRHPNVVSVRGTGSTPSGHWVAMELVSGFPLAAALESRSLGRNALIDVIAKVARGLDAARRAGIVHGDVRAERILIDAQGEPRLSGFGAGRPDESCAWDSYVAPEVRKTGEATEASDVFSLGAILFAGLAGKPPFGSDRGAVLARSARGELEAFPGDVPARVEKVCRAALAFQPDKRPRAAALAASLASHAPEEPSGGGSRALARVLTAASVLALALVAAAFARGRSSPKEAGTPTSTASTSPSIESTDGDDVRSMLPEGFPVLCRPCLRSRMTRLAGVYGTFHSRHRDCVSALAFSEDGRYVVSGDRDGALKVWDVHERRLLRTRAAHEGPVCAASFSPDGREIVSAGDDREIRTFDAGTGRQLLARPIAELVLGKTRDRSGSYSIKLFALSSGARHALAGGSDGTLYVCDMESGTSRQLSTRLRFAVGAAFDRHGTRVIAFDKSGTLKAWDTRTGMELAEWKPAGAVRSVALSPDGQSALEGNADGTLVLRKIASTAAPVRTLERHADAVLCVSFSPDGKRAISSGRDDSARVWDLETGREVLEIGRHVNPVTVCAFAPDGKLAATGAEDASLRVWDVSSAALGQEIPFPEEASSAIFALGVSASGESILTGNWDGWLRSWNVVSAKEEWARLAHRGAISTLSVGTRDAGTGSALVLTGGYDAKLKLWDLSTGSPVAEFHAPAGLEAVAISPDSKRALTSGWNHEASIFDPGTRARLADLRGHTRSIFGLAWLPAGRAITASEDRTLKVWDAESESVVFTLEGHRESVRGVAVSPDGRRAVSASTDRTLRVWDLGAGACLHELVGHEGEVWSVALSPRENIAVSAGREGTVRIWNLDTFEEIDRIPVPRFRGDQDRIEVAFSPDGKWFAVALDRGAVLRFELVKAPSGPR